MGVTVSDFEKVDEFGPVEKLQREVRTPVKNGVEANRMVLYRAGGYVVKVAKVSTYGWGVTLYEEGEDLPENRCNRYFDEEGSAHQRAREYIEEVLR